jgi:DNA polymerase-3 subunit delta'
LNDPDAIEGAAPVEVGNPLGHDMVLAAVEAQLHAGRLPTAFLMHGPRGIGKATTAFELARRILLATGDEARNRVDEQVAAGSHPNLQVLRRRPRDGKGYFTVIRVEDIRDLRDSLHMTRGRAGQRVAILDAIDDCNVNAANALLKTLEEPPPDTTFLLISHRPGGLLPTIRSRCRTVAMRAPGQEVVRTIIERQLPDTPPETLTAAVTRSEGRPRRGFEAVNLGATGVLSQLEAWLAAPAAHGASLHIAIGDALAAAGWGTETAFAKDLLIDWVAEEARSAALSGERRQLASANELWEKAETQFAEAEALNLDLRQTFVGLFDAIRAHVQTSHPQPAETP